jgi:hypothetical protein
MSEFRYCPEGRRLEAEHGKDANQAVLARLELDRQAQDGNSLSHSAEREEQLRKAEVDANEAARRWREHFWHCPICSDAR